MEYELNEPRVSLQALHDVVPHVHHPRCHRIESVFAFVHNDRRISVIGIPFIIIIFIAAGIEIVIVRSVLRAQATVQLQHDPPRCRQRGTADTITDLLEVQGPLVYRPRVQCPCGLGGGGGARAGRRGAGGGFRARDDRRGGGGGSGRHPWGRRWTSDRTVSCHVPSSSR